MHFHYSVVFMHVKEKGSKDKIDCHWQVLFSMILEKTGK